MQPSSLQTAAIFLVPPAFIAYTFSLFSSSSAASTAVHAAQCTTASGLTSEKTAFTASESVISSRLYGAETIHVPKFINEIRVSKNVIRKIDKISRKYVFTIEKITCQRLSFLCGSRAKKVHNIVLLIFAIASAVPIPMLCIIPALGGALLSIALVVSDGLLVIISWLVGAVGISIIWTAIIAFIKVKDVVML